MNIRVRRKYRVSNKGIALITTLLVVALLVAVIVEFNRIAMADIDISKNFSDGQKILYIGISGVNAIKDALFLDGLYGKFDGLNDEWNQSRSYFDIAASILEEGSLDGSINDENGKINVNALVNEKGEFNPVQKDLWDRLLSQVRFSLREEEINLITHCVKDWLDSDEEISGLHGAEDAFYREKGYPCRNSRLNVLEEMLLIKGISSEIFYGNKDKEGIRPYFTVYGDGKININTAPLPVLIALSDSMTEDIALEMDAFRKDKVNSPYLQNKLWYKKVWPYEEALPESNLTTSSNVFTVRITARLHETVKEIMAVVDRSKKGAEIIFWREL